MLRVAARRLCTAAPGASWRLRPARDGQTLFEICAQQPSYGVGSRLYRKSWEAYGYTPEEHHIVLTSVKHIHQVRTPPRRSRRAARAIAQCAFPATAGRPRRRLRQQNVEGRDERGAGKPRADGVQEGVGAAGVRHRPRPATAIRAVPREPHLSACMFT